MKLRILLLSLLATAGVPHAARCAAAPTADSLCELRSGGAALCAERRADGYALRFRAEGEELSTARPDYPVTLEIDRRPLDARYDVCRREGPALHCVATLRTPAGSRFRVEDRYTADTAGAFTLDRCVEVLKAAAADRCFNSLFGFTVGEGRPLTADEYFVPGVWYRSNFLPEANLPAACPRPDDSCFLYRADRTPLPLVMFRNPDSHLTLAVTHADADPRTVMADAERVPADAGYQFGASGVRRTQGRTCVLFLFPGNEEGRRGGLGFRAHPVARGVRHRYRLDLRLWHSDDYPSALRASWERAFALLDPPLCPVDLQRAYDGLIATLEHYYAPSRRTGGVYDVPGMPFQVSLEDFKPVGYNYQMGFVGMQVATSYYLFREGVERDDRHLRDLGAEALDFWATRSLTPLGLPRPWYDPDTKGGEGTFRRMNNLRTVTGGMESLLAAWNYARSAGLDRPAWLDACRRFGEWLVENQNPDGSYFFSHDHTRIEAGRHPVTLDDKGLTLCAVPFLAKLHRATGREEFRTAALRAGEYGYAESHCKYLYRSGVVDNPQTIDSESGQLAMQAFLALYDLDGRRRWLDAAVQAATYTETWMYALDIPVEEDRTGPTVYPRDRSVVGQHLIAIGHAAADTGFAWTSFLYYRLYLETGREHFLRVARLAAHNTKQSMNWDGSLYPGAPHGLQLEAFRILVPRRAKGVNTTLNWSYAAHLEPMMHFRDAFGTPDLEAVERLPLDQRLRRLKSYRDRMQAPVAPHRAPNGQPN